MRDAPRNLDLAISPKTLRRRALKLRCPICGKGRPFVGIFGMREQCEHCRYKYARESGYFLGSIYINYALTGLLAVAWAIYATIYLEGGLFVKVLIPTIVMIIVPCLFLRHARALWMAFDLSWDPATEDDFPKSE